MRLHRTNSFRLAGMLLVVVLASPVAHGASEGAFFTSAVPAGRVTIELSCSVPVTTTEGAMIAGFSVDADLNGLTESSVLDVTTWDRGRLQPSVFIPGHGLEGPAVDAELSGGTYTVHATATWGTQNRSWSATIHAGCASTAGAPADASLIVDGTSIPASAPGRLLALAARDFNGVAIAPGIRKAIAIDGSYELIDDGYILGSFGVTYGSISMTPPGGATAARATPGETSFFISSGTRGPWDLRIERGILRDPPYAVIALSFG